MAVDEKVLGAVEASVCVQTPTPTPTPHELKNRSEIVLAYRLAAQTHDPAVWAEIMTQYPLLVTAYHYRESILEQQANKSDAERISVMSLDKFIIKKIADGELADLSPAAVKYDAGLQP